jgi:hypothetical protein
MQFNAIGPSDFVDQPFRRTPLNELIKRLLATA